MKISKNADGGVEVTCDIIEETLKSLEKMRQTRSQWGTGTVCLEVN